MIISFSPSCYSCSFSLTRKYFKGNQAALFYMKHKWAVIHIHNLKWQKWKKTLINGPYDLVFKIWKAIHNIVMSRIHFEGSMCVISSSGAKWHCKNNHCLKQISWTLPLSTIGHIDTWYSPSPLVVLTLWCLADWDAKRAIFWYHHIVFLT